VPRGQRDGCLRPYSRFSRQEPLLFLSSTHYLSENLVDPGIEPGTPGPVVRNSDHYNNNDPVNTDYLF
jgi:hypothetical protein